MNPRRTPFLRFFWPFVAGLLLGAGVDYPISGLSFFILFLAFALILLGMLVFRYRLRWMFGVWLYCLLFVFGYSYMVSHHESRVAGHFSERLHSIKYVVGMVYDAPSSGGKLKIPVRVEWVGSSLDSMIPANGNLLFFADTGSIQLRYGDRISVRANIAPTEGPKNPHAFDYSRYLHFQNIHYQSFVKKDSIQYLSGGHGSMVWRLAFDCRERLLTLLQRYFPTADEYAVAGALLLGYKDELSDDMRTAYAETGSMHALAVSGSHVAMLYVGLMFLMARFKRFLRKRWMETLLILVFIWAFTFLTGATASVLRASAMFSTYMIGRLLQKEPLVWNVLPASATLLLLFNPYFLFDAGFQLSYAAVCGMVFFYPYLLRLVPLSRHWFQQEIVTVLMVGIAAQIGTLPLSLFYFHQFPVYFWLAGWIVVFGGAVFLWGGALLIVLDACCPFLANFLGKALYGMLWLMNKLIFLIHALPGGLIQGVWVPIGSVVALYGCIIMFGKMLEVKRGIWLVNILMVMGLLGIFRNMSLLPKAAQEKIVVYQVSKKTCIDFFDGRQVYMLADSLSNKQLQFAVMTNRWASGVQAASWMLGADSIQEYPNLRIEKPFVQFFDTRIVLLDDVQWLEHGNGPFPADVLLIAKNPEIDIRKAMQVFPCKMLVFDASNSYKNVKAWKQACASVGQKYWDVKEEGALELGNYELKITNYE